MSNEEVSPAPGSSSVVSLLAGTGEMATLMRSHDWSDSTLGSPEDWSQALRTSVRLMLNTGHPLCIWWGAEGTCLYNDAYRRFLGPEHHPGSLGQPVREVWSENWSMIGPQIEQVMGGGGSTWDENRLVPITRHGRREDAYWTYSYSPIDDDTMPLGIGGVLAICAETTEHVLSERRAAADAERQRRMFEHAPGFICVLSGPEHVFEFVNKAYVRLTGSREFIGSRARDVLPDVEGQGFFELLDQVYTSGKPHVAHQLPIRLRQSESDPLDLRYLDFIYAPMFDDGGRVNGVFVEGHDVTDARRTQLALLASDANQRLLIDSATSFAIVTLDPSNMIQSWNSGAERLLGYSEAEALGQSGKLFFTPEDVAMHAPEQEMAEASARGRGKNERWHVRKDGSRFWGSGLMMPIEDSSGFVKIFQDRTEAHDQQAQLVAGAIALQGAQDELRTLNAELEHRVKAAVATRETALARLHEAQKVDTLGQLTGGVAHDFNNLLTPIMGGLDLLARKLPDDDRAQRIATGAMQSAERARVLVQRLLSFGRRQTLQSRAVDVATLIEGMRELIERSLGPSIKVCIDVPVHLPAVEVDPNQLELALLNLSINARDAMPEGGVLTVTAMLSGDGGEHQQGQIAIYVADTGAGMDAETLARATEPFFTTKPVGQGTGLGLSMVFGLAAQSGGSADPLEQGRGGNDR